MSIRSYEILVVDDDRTSRKVAEFKLRRLGFMNVDTASDGIEALRHVAAKHYDLLLLDNNMPRMSGLEFLRNCKEVSILDGTTVVMVTGSADGRTLEAVKSEGLKVDDFIVKPLDADVLSSKLDRLGGLYFPWCEADRNSETGTYLSLNLEIGGKVSRLRIFGVLHQDDSASLKDIPDHVALLPSEALIIDVRNVVSIDEFGIGMLLLINGVACHARKITYLLTDDRTIKGRLLTLGVGSIMQIIDRIADVRDAAGTC